VGLSILISQNDFAWQAWLWLHYKICQFFSSKNKLYTYSTSEQYPDPDMILFGDLPPE
jgi:hypothetical protein